jgi:hypothetical protein
MKFSLPDCSRICSGRKLFTEEAFQHFAFWPVSPTAAKVDMVPGLLSIPYYAEDFKSDDMNF